MTPRKPFTAKQRLKCFEDHGAIVLCQYGNCDSAIYIKGCHIDHGLALIDGGKHEDANFFPICLPCHKKKSAREHRNNAKAKRVHAKHFGQGAETKPKRRLTKGRSLRGRVNPWPKCDRPIPSRPFQKRPEAKI